MIQAFQAVFTATLQILQLEFTVYEYTLSFWKIFLWSFIAGAILWFLGGLFGDD